MVRLRPVRSPSGRLWWQREKTILVWLQTNLDDRVSRVGVAILHNDTM